VGSWEMLDYTYARAKDDFSCRRGMLDFGSKGCKTRFSVKLHASCNAI